MNILSLFRKNRMLALAVIAFLLFIIPIVVYAIKFYNHAWSDNPADWGTFGDYIGGLTGVIIAIGGILISYEFNETSLKKQEKSLRPLAYINASDFEDRIYVGINNSGLGPLLIKDFKVFDFSGEIKKALIDFMPELPENYFWSNFFGNPIGYVIKEGADLTLIEIDSKNISFDNSDLFDSEGFLADSAYIELFSQIRDEIRLVLSNLTIEIEYEDIFENKMPIVERKLDWFARNLH